MRTKFLIASVLTGVAVAGGIAVAAPMGHGPMGADANNDGNVTRAELTAALDKKFAELDKNGDGKVTQEERRAMHEARFAERFKQMDKDGNGQISMAEMQAAREARREGPGKHMGGHPGGMHGGHMGMMM